METLQTVLVILLVTALIIYRQSRTVPTARPGVLYIAAAMVVIGVVSGGLIDPRHLTVSVIVLVAEAVSAVGLGVWRAATVRVWTDAAGVAWSKATGWTLLVWLVSVAARAGMYFAGQHFGLAPSVGGILVFLGLTLAAQGYVVARRGRALTGAANRPVNFVG